MFKTRCSPGARSITGVTLSLMLVVSFARGLPNVRTEEDWKEPRGACEVKREGETEPLVTTAEKAIGKL